VVWWERALRFGEGKGRFRGAG
jgi:hypothetical protein